MCTFENVNCVECSGGSGAHTYMKETRGEKLKFLDLYRS